MKNSIKNFVKAAPIAAAMLVPTLGQSQEKEQQIINPQYTSVISVDSTSYNQKLNVRDFDAVIPMSAIYRAQFRKDGIENPTKQDSLDVAQKLFCNALEYKTQKPSIDNIRSVALKKNSDGSVALTYIVDQSYTAKATTSDEVINDPNRTWAEKLIAANFFDIEEVNPKNNSSSIEKHVSKKSDYDASSLTVFGSMNVPLGDLSPDEKLGYNAGISVPVVGALSLELGGTFGNYMNTESLSATELSRVLRASGREYVSTQFDKENIENKVVGFLGLGYTFNKEKMPVTLYAGTNVLSQAANSSSYVKDEVFFNGNLEGEGTTAQDYPSIDAKAKMNVGGFTAGVRVEPFNNGMTIGAGMKQYNNGVENVTTPYFGIGFKPFNGKKR